MFDPKIVTNKQGLKFQFYYCDHCPNRLAVYAGSKTLAARWRPLGKKHYCSKLACVKEYYRLTGQQYGASRKKRRKQPRKIAEVIPIGSRRK